MTNTVYIPENKYGIPAGEYNFMTLRQKNKDDAVVLGFILDMLEE